MKLGIDMFQSKPIFGYGPKIYRVKCPEFIKKYNKIHLVKKVDFDLSNYITVKTIDGIFFLISEEEKKIRNNPKARNTELLQKIFK